MAQQNDFELGEMARFSEEKIVSNPSTAEVRNRKWERIDPFYLQDKAESSQDFKPLFFSSCALRQNCLYKHKCFACKHAVINLSGSLLVCYLYFPLFEIFFVVFVC